MGRSTLLLLAVLWSATAHAELRATATKTSLSITGATPLGRLAVCRVGNDRIDGVETSFGQQRVVFANHDGTAIVPADSAALRAIWLALDLTAGGYVIATPPGYTPRLIAPPVISSQGLKAGRTLRWSRPVMDVWIAGKRGIWHGAAAAGRASDDEPLGDGTVSFSLSRLEKNGDKDNNDM